VSVFFKNKIEIILLLPIIALTVLFRLPSYIPFTWKSDELDYLSAVQEIINGGVLYVSYGDIKPPLLFWLYTLACQIGGDINIFYIKTMGIVFSVITVITVFFLAKQLGGNRLAFVSGLLFATFSICARGEEMLASNSELLMNAFIVPAYLFFFSFLQNRSKYLLLTGASLFLAGAFFINQKAGINLVVFVLVLFFVAVQHQNYRQFFKNSSYLVLLFLLPSMLFVSYYAAIGHLDEFYYWLVKMPSAYINSYDIATRFERIILRFEIFFAGYWALVIPFFCGIWVIIKGQWYKQPLWLAVILYLIFSIIAVVVGAKMMERYFIQLLPAFFILSALGLLNIYQIIENLNIKKKYQAKILAQVLLILFLFISPLKYLQQHYHTSKPKLVNIANSPSLHGIKTIVDNNSLAEDKIFVFPKDRYYYYFLQRRNATRFNEIETHLSKAKMYPQENALFKQGWNYLYSDLKQGQPKFIIDISGNFGFKDGEPTHIREMKEGLKNYIEENYTQIGSYVDDVLYQIKS